MNEQHIWRSKPVPHTGTGSGDRYAVWNQCVVNFFCLWAILCIPAKTTAYSWPEGRREYRYRCATRVNTGTGTDWCWTSSHHFSWRGIYCSQKAGKANYSFPMKSRYMPHAIQDFTIVFNLASIRNKSSQITASPMPVSIIIMIFKRTHTHPQRWWWSWNRRGSWSCR